MTASIVQALAPHECLALEEDEGLGEDLWQYPCMLLQLGLPPAFVIVVEVVSPSTEEQLQLGPPFLSTTMSQNLTDAASVPTVGRAVLCRRWTHPTSYRENGVSLLLQSEPLCPDVRRAIGNRVGDCEVCQDVCPWNRRHLRDPLATDLTKSFRARVRDLEELFSLPSLGTMSEERCVKELGRFDTGIPSYRVFARNVRVVGKNA